MAQSSVHSSAKSTRFRFAEPRTLNSAASIVNVAQQESTLATWSETNLLMNSSGAPSGVLTGDNGCGDCARCQPRVAAARTACATTRHNARRVTGYSAPATRQRAPARRRRIVCAPNARRPTTMAAESSARWRQRTRRRRLAWRRSPSHRRVASCNQNATVCGVRDACARTASDARVRAHTCAAC